MNNCLSTASCFKHTGVVIMVPIFSSCFSCFFYFYGSASLLCLWWLVKMKHRCPSETQWVWMFSHSLQFLWISPSRSTRPMSHENTSFFILPIFLTLWVLAMCPCPMWVSKRMREVFSCVLGPMQEFTGVWVRDPRIQKEDFWHAYMDYEICIHVSAIRTYDTKWSKQLVETSWLFFIFHIHPDKLFGLH